MLLDVFSQESDDLNTISPTFHKATRHISDFEKKYGIVLKAINVYI